jgi:hypothetical protein
MVWSGVRTFCRIIATSVSSCTPRRSSFSGGICSPSSNTSRGSGLRILPPMSGAWAVLALKATTRPSRKMGLATVMSGRCPVPSQRSLVISTSPGSSVSSGKWWMKCFTVSGRVPMKEGMLSVACTSDCPRASVTTQEKS